MFSINPEIGAGLVLWHPKGALIRRIIRNVWEREHLRNGYHLVCTPHIARGELWKTSGHLEYYAENMYIFEKDGEPYVIKPMNCPFHIQIYKAKPRSYKELPIRYAEWGTVYRYERSGTIQGLLRVRGFTQDDAHIFCAPQQVDEEILKILDFAERFLKLFGFDEYKVELSTRDPKNLDKYMGSDEEWESAENALARAIEKKGIPYKEMKGEAVFYGPKIDIKIVDASGRSWQCSTIQFDFNLPKRFNLTYTGPNGKERMVFMVHRTLLGSIERFIGILIEHYKGNFPVWLAPVQVRVLPISDKYVEYAEKIHRKLSSLGVRSELDASPTTVSYKIREAEMQKIPFMVICGKREAESGVVSIRKHGGAKLNLLTLEEFVDIIRREEARCRV